MAYNIYTAPYGAQSLLDLCDVFILGDCWRCTVYTESGRLIDIIHNYYSTPMVSGRRFSITENPILIATLLDYGYHIICEYGKYKQGGRLRFSKDDDTYELRLREEEEFTDIIPDTWKKLYTIPYSSAEGSLI